MPSSVMQTGRTITRGSSQGLLDVENFIQTVNNSDAHMLADVRELFDVDAEIFIARAPGRLDVMGGIADYSGSLVLEMPIAEATLVAMQRAQTNDRQSNTPRNLKIVSLSQDGTREATFEMSLTDFERDGKPISYEEAQAYFHHDPSRHWAAYAAGVFLVLMRERGVRFNDGARLLISSGVPEGKGVSSSAAIEVACMSAVCAAFGIEMAARDLAVLCQKVENAVVGAPCGVMDQMTSACGEAGKLLALLCQPAELQGTVELPTDLAVWGLDSGVRHSVGSGDYGSVRTGAFIGYRIIAEIADLKVSAGSHGNTVAIDDSLLNGYLANVTPSEFETSFLAYLPEQISGEEFLKRLGGTTDAVTRIDARRTYAVRQPTAHAIYENHRVRLFAELIKGDAGERRNELLGELMYQSHASYGRCGLGSEGTDLLVSFVREAGVNGGLYGAKITGGGSGGTVAVLGRRDARATIEQVIEKYERAMNHKPYVFAGTSPGSAAFGFIKLGRSSDS